MCDISFDETCDVFSETRQKARKSYRCDCCGGTIQRGELYLRNFSVFDGDVSTEKMCSPCDADREAFVKEHGVSFVPSYLTHALDECVDEADSTYIEAEDKYVLDAEGQRWQDMLDKIKARRRAVAENKIGVS